MTVTIAKINNQVVQVIKTAETVAFSQQKNWVLITPDVGVPTRKQQHFKWVPATTRFEWVRVFNYG